MVEHVIVGIYGDTEKKLETIIVSWGTTGALGILGKEHGKWNGHSGCIGYLFQ